jgi:hypothetical protein
MKRPETPLLEQLRIDRNKSLLLSEFLDWIEEEGLQLSAYSERGYNLEVVAYSKERLIGRFLGIDPVALDKEREALLEYQRWLNDTDPCPKCEGKGEIEGDYHRDERPCTNCNETGRVEKVEAA